MKRIHLFVALMLVCGNALYADPPKPGEIEASVVKQIERDSAKQFGLGKITAKCDKAPEKPKDGDTFACSATTKGNRKVAFLAKINVLPAGNVKVSLTATNILDRGSIAELVKKVLPEIETQIGEKVTAKDVGCGNYHIFSDAADMRIPCVVTAPTSKQKRKAEIHFTKSLITVEVEQPKDAKTQETQGEQKPLPPA